MVDEKRNQNLPPELIAQLREDLAKPPQTSGEIALDRVQVLEARLERLEQNLMDLRITVGSMRGSLEGLL